MDVQGQHNKKLQFAGLVVNYAIFNIVVLEIPYSLPLKQWVVNSWCAELKPLLDHPVLSWYDKN